MSSMEEAWDHLLDDYDWEGNNGELSSSVVYDWINRVDWENDMFVKQFAFGDINKVKKSRNSWTLIKDWDDTSWGSLIKDPLVKDCNSRVGKTFRRRFRVPFPIFEYVVDLCREHNIFDMNSCFKERIPIQIKVLVCLRILGRANCADDISEMSFVGESTCNYLFKTFVINFSKLKDMFIIQPAVGSELLKRIMDEYAALGLPGCVGSMDCTHLHWDKCPSTIANLCTGKPFEVIN